MSERPSCRYDRETKAHLSRAHRSDCTAADCRGCLPCVHDDHGNPVRHCRVRLRCTSHLGWTEHACPTCLSKIRLNLTQILSELALMPAEAMEQGIDSEPANLAGPHADYVTAQWRLVNADRAGESVDELDLRDPFTCLTMHERTIREDLGHDDVTLVSPTIAASVGYLSWVLTDLARDEEQIQALTDLLGDSARLVMHMESARHNSRTPERGVPCPECTGLGKVAPRLVRHHGHWCEDHDCTRLHYLDESGDVWRCPMDPEHEWSHEGYTLRLEERRKPKIDTVPVPSQTTAV